MIADLRIRNIALIAEEELEFSSGLSVLTGETGAGKSMLLGALSLLLGERASADLIRADCETATVEARFDLADGPRIAEWLAERDLPACEDGSLIVKREIARSGRSKCSVNGGLALLAHLQQLGEMLVDLHGQHEHQSLLHKDRQRDLLDAWGELGALRAETGAAFAQLKKCREAQERLNLDESERRRRLDMLEFQIQEIETAQVTLGEKDALAEERSRLAHAERIVQSLQEVLEILHRREATSVRDSLAAAAESLAHLTPLVAELGAQADLLRSAEIQVSEVVDRVADFLEKFEADPARLEAVEERLDALAKLFRKYGEDETALLAFAENARKERDQLAGQAEAREDLLREEGQWTQQLSGLAERLSQARVKAGKELGKKLGGELKELGFAQAVFEVRVTPREDPEGWIGWGGKRIRCGASGADEVEFWIAPNPGEEAKPVAKTASGGELSRIMLALKVAAVSVADVPVLIFDEVDAGIGGAVAEAVGRKLKLLGQKRQVLVITHLPQIARFATRHFQVSKRIEQGRTSTRVTPLLGEERVREIARLLAGDQITPTALQHARELIGS